MDNLKQTGFISSVSLERYHLNDNCPKWNGGAHCITGSTETLIYAPGLVNKFIMPIDSNVCKHVLKQFYPEDVPLVIAPAPVLNSREIEKKWRIKTPDASVSSCLGFSIAALVPLSEETRIQVNDKLHSENEIVILNSTLDFSFIGCLKVALLAVANHDFDKIQKAWESAFTNGFIDSSVIPCDALQVESLSVHRDLESLTREWSGTFFKSKQFYVPVIFGITKTNIASAMEKHWQEFMKCRNEISQFPKLLQEYCKPQLVSCENQQHNRDALRRSLGKLMEKIHVVKQAIPWWSAIEERFNKLHEEFRSIPLDGVTGIAVKLALISSLLNSFPSSLVQTDLEKCLTELENKIYILKDFIDEKTKKPKKSKKRLLEDEMLHAAMRLYHLLLKIEGLERVDEVAKFETLYLNRKSNQLKPLEFKSAMEKCDEFLKLMAPFILEGDALVEKVNQLYQEYKDSRNADPKLEVLFQAAQAAKGKFCIHVLNRRLEGCPFIIPTVDPNTLDMTDTSPLTKTEMEDFRKKLRKLSPNNSDYVKLTIGTRNWPLIKASRAQVEAIYAKYIK